MHRLCPSFRNLSCTEGAFMKQRDIARRSFLLGAAPRLAGDSVVAVPLLAGISCVRQSDANGVPWSALLPKAQSVHRDPADRLPVRRHAEAAA